MNYNQAISYLGSLERFGIQLRLINILSLLAFLGDPQKDLRAVHIAGTNGKGSTAAFLFHILKEAGIKTGVYTSPHLLDLLERIRIDSRLIPKERLARLTTRIKPYIDRLQATYFEALTAIAFTYFKEEGVDLSIIEVGLGGRLDATNVIRPLISIITNIDLDHTDRLGKNLEEIAYEKAGIIKEGGIVITAEEKCMALNVIEAVCKNRNARLYRIGKEIIVSGNTVFGIKGVYDDLKIGLLGDYQMVNAAMAIAAIELLTEYGFNVSRSHILKGLKETIWPGRLEIVKRRPLLILDGAHNPAAAKRLVEVILKDFRFSRLILILGILKDKDVDGILSPFFSTFKDHLVIVSEPKTSRGLKKEELAKIVGRFTPHFKIKKDVKSSLEEASYLARDDDLICVTGSLCTIADAKKAILEV